MRVVGLHATGYGCSCSLLPPSLHSHFSWTLPSTTCIKVSWPALLTRCCQSFTSMTTSPATELDAQPLTSPPTTALVELPYQSDPTAAVAIPPLLESTTLGARVEHLLAREAGLISDTVSKSLGLSKGFVQELIRFGAVHWCPVLPSMPADSQRPVDEVHTLELDMARAAASAAVGRSPGFARPVRATHDVRVNQWAYIRVHVHPKRFPAVYTTIWKGRIVCDEDDFVVVNKPAGVNVAPTVDNVVECCLTCAAQAVGWPQPLMITHRLDGCTEGLVVLGKTKAFVKYFNQLLQHDAKVRKYYRTLTAAAPPLGSLVHYVTTNVQEPGMPPRTGVHESQVPGSFRCELEVLSVRQVALCGRAAELWGDSAYEALLLLKTGRTHQIRAQLSAVGTPLLGDALYMLSHADSLGIKEATIGCAASARTARPLEPPTGAIGLQSCKLEINDAAWPSRPNALPVSYEAGLPWWRVDADG